MEERVPSHAAAEPKTTAEYERELEAIFAEIRLLNDQMDERRQERERLRAESQRLKEETRRLRDETRAGLARLASRS